MRSPRDSFSQLLFLSLLVATTRLYGQVVEATPEAAATPASPASTEGEGTVVTQAKPEPQTPAAKTIRQRVNDWLGTKGWKQGKNPDGSYIAFSTAGYELKNKQWAVVRSNAFQAALLDAKRKLAERLAVDVGATVASAISRGQPPVKEDGQPVDIVESMLDLAKNEGAGAAALGTQTRFGRAVRVLCRAEVAGSQVVKVFDGLDPAGNGAMAVVVRWTPLTADVVETVLGVRKEKVMAPDVAAVTALDAMSESELDSLFGARVMRDASGEACVVAFGQGDVLGQTEAAMGAAERVASADAMGNLRQFVGELVVCQQVLERRSTIDDIVGAEAIFKSDESFTELCESRMNDLQFQGVDEHKTWEGQTGGKFPTMGVVKKWTASSATEANELRRRFESLAASRGGSGRRDIPGPQQQGAQGGGKPVFPPVKTIGESPDLD
jgi:hypothetical protein